MNSTTNKEPAMNTKQKVSSATLSIGDVFWFSGYWVEVTKIEKHERYNMVIGKWAHRTDASNTGSAMFAYDTTGNGLPPLMVTKKNRS